MVTNKDIRDWVLRVRSRTRSPATVQHYRSTVTAFVNAVGGDVTKDRVQDWFEELDTTSAPATVQNRLAIVKLFCNWLLEEGVVSEDVCRGLRAQPVTAPVVTPLSKDEITRLIKAARSARDRAIIALLASTGMRLGELEALREDCVDLSKLLVLIERGKGGRPRAVAFDARTGDLIATYLRRERGKYPQAGLPWLWLGKKGRLTRKGIALALEHAAAGAGIKGMHPHLLRHTWAHHSLASGKVAEGDICAAAGWRSRAMLDRYSRALANDRSVEAFRRLYDS